MLKKLILSSPFQIVLVLLFSFFFGQYLPYGVKGLFYGVSLSITEGLIAFLPWMIFSFIFSSSSSLRGKAFVYFVILGGFICASNWVAAWTAYVAGKTAWPWLHIPESFAGNSGAGLEPLFRFSIPRIVSNDQALLAGILFGIVAGASASSILEQVATKLKNISNFVLARIIVPLIPILVLGSCLKFQHDGILEQIIRQYGVLLAFVVSIEAVYLGLGSFALAGGRPKVWVGYLKNLWFPVATGFSTMSSAVAMPANIRAAEENTGNPALARIVIPATVNIHLIGDGIFVPLLALAVLHSFGMGFPDPAVYLIFSGYFVLAKFSIAAVPGGGILVMLPVLERHLGFKSEMLPLITALYILFDPIITSCNVAGNGIFAILLNEILGRGRAFGKNGDSSHETNA